MRHVVFSAEGIYFKDGNNFGIFNADYFLSLLMLLVLIDEMPDRVKSVATLTDQSLIVCT